MSSNAQAKTWVIGNSRLHLTLAMNAANDLVIQELLSPPTLRTLGVNRVPDHSMTINGKTLSPGASTSGFVLAAATAVATDFGVRLAFVFNLASPPVRAVRYYACYSGSPTIETWTTLEVTGSSQVTVANPIVWQLAVPEGVVHHVSGLVGDEPNNPHDTAFEIHASEVPDGGGLVLAAKGRSSEGVVPVVAIDVASDEFFGGLAWSGSWQMLIETSDGRTNVTASLPNLQTTVDPTQAFETPHGFFGFTPGGMKDVSEALRAFIDQGVRQGRPLDPLVIYNTWFAYGTEIDEESMKAEMIGVAALGAEVFVLDAGWYPGAGLDGPFDFSSGLGVYAADPARFPSGLRALSDFAHSVGLKFGIWVEPERADLGNIGRPGLVQQAWLATANGSYDPGRLPAEQTAAQICLGSPAARAWLLDQLSQFIEDAQPDYLKWDNNFWINCNRSGHGHGTADGNFAHVNGLYALLAELRRRFPELVIENVSGGGNRLDLGMMRYTDTAWMDDRTVPSAKVRRNLGGLSAIFPPTYLLSVVLDSVTEPLHRASDLPLMMSSRMAGILGLTLRTADMDPRDQADLSHHVQLYKNLREIQRDANAQLLTDQAAMTDGPPWDGLQELSAGSGAMLIYAFQNDTGESSVTVLPRGLQSGITYDATTAEGRALGSATGADLMESGIQIVASPASAAHVLILRPQRQMSETPQSMAGTRRIGGLPETPPSKAAKRPDGRSGSPPARLPPTRVAK